MQLCKSTQASCTDFVASMPVPSLSHCVVHSTGPRQIYPEANGHVLTMKLHWILVEDRIHGLRILASTEHGNNHLVIYKGSCQHELACSQHRNQYLDIFHPPQVNRPLGAHPLSPEQKPPRFPTVPRYKVIRETQQRSRQVSSRMP